MSAGPIDGSIPLPVALRGASPERRQAWEAGAGFERVLLSQLLEPVTEDMAADAGPYASELTDALAGAVVSGGGIGLADRLADQIDAQQRGAA
ncbi:MAG TPA: hypothetical protein VHB30_05530 [Solirubrobacteraceae bacterium]|jgi:hypothetical protein|nr:hypothetical protein [Solirubrobacteraceae bacterium]